MINKRRMGNEARLKNSWQGKRGRNDEQNLRRQGRSEKAIIRELN